ncbi:MAG: MBOAT family protein [Nitrospirae bacterium]|nr:MBOAT family protein [Nitrospirota bacterium]
MVFSSVIFLFFFLPVVLTGYFLMKQEWRNPFLLAASLFFYYWGEGKYAIVMAAYMVFNYYFGLRIEKCREMSSPDGDTRAKSILLLSLGFNLGMFILFKYTDFIIENLGYPLRFAGFSISAPQVHLPIGISFFTFQALSYVIDVYRRDVKAQKSLINFSMYKALFPQLIAGPIVRYRDVAGQVENRTVTVGGFYSGAERFITGLGKKVIIANSVASVADMAFNAAPNGLSAGAAWLGAVCYAIQIYFDFSGYSDMAIGLGRMFGFDFLENFNYPYISSSIREFWRRWHISLSTWFRDYLYIPLGGGRATPRRVYLNLIIVFLLCGLWHGANWTFVIWGLWHGVFLVLERTKFGAFIERLPKPMAHIYASMVVLAGWVFFRAETPAASAHYLAAMCGFSGGDITAAELLNPKAAAAIMAGIAGCMPVGRVLQSIGSHQAYAYARTAMLFSVFMISVILLSGDTYNPFIYFRF